jgi:hypothetical protein
MFRCMVFALAWLPILAVSGCGSADAGLESISGTITLKNAPLKAGTITFMSDSGMSGGPIVEGKYTVEKAKGLKPGTYKVMISSGDPNTTAPPEEAPGDSSKRPVAKEMVPKEYNTETKQTVEVKKGGPNVFNFDIP